MEESFGEKQFSFKSEKGTRDVIGLLRVIKGRCVERGQRVSLRFFGLKKAFDRVKSDKMIKILVDWKMD